jgi:hypothetical protein
MWSHRITGYKSGTVVVTGLVSLGNDDLIHIDVTDNLRPQGVVMASATLSAEQARGLARFLLAQLDPTSYNYTVEGEEHDGP